MADAQPWSSLRELADALPDPVYLKDPRQRYVMLNEAAARLLARPREEVVGRRDADLFPRDVVREIERMERLAISQGGYTFEEVFRGDIVMLTTKVPQFDEQGRYVGLLGISRDITRQKQLERSLVRQLKQKDDFVAVLVHELRDPVAAIRTAIDVHKSVGSAEPQVVAAAEVIDRQLGLIQRLLADMTDIVRVGRGKLSLEMGPLDLRDLVQTVVRDSWPRRDSCPALVFRPGSAPVRVKADRGRMVQVLVNLLDNARKFTPPDGRVIVTCDASCDIASLRVTDTGIGMDRETLGTAFDEFRQGRRGAGLRDGLGLGLALVKRIVELHAGTVRAHSDGPGRGTTITIELPLATS